MEPDKLEALLFQFFEREVHLILSQGCHGHFLVQQLGTDSWDQLLYVCMSYDETDLQVSSCRSGGHCRSLWSRRTSLLRF